MSKGAWIVLGLIVVAGAGTAAWYFLAGPGAGNDEYARAIVQFDNLASDNSTSTRRLLAVRAPPTPSIGTAPDSFATPTMWGRQVIYVHVRETNSTMQESDCVANTPDEDKCWTEIVFEAKDCCLYPDEPELADQECTFEGDHCCCAEDEDTLGDRDCECSDGTTRTVTEFFDLGRDTATVNADLNSQGLPIFNENQDQQWAEDYGDLAVFRSVTVMFGAHEEIQVDVNGTLSDEHDYLTDVWSDESDFTSPNEWKIEEGDVITISLAYDLTDRVAVWDSEPAGAPDSTASTCWSDTASGKYLCFYAPGLTPSASKTTL